MAPTYINIHSRSTNKFHWIRVDTDASSLQSSIIDPKTAAYVRRLDVFPGENPKLASGALTLIPAAEAIIESPIIGSHQKEIVSYDEIASMQLRPFTKKAKWFLDTSEKLRVDWDEGHMLIYVRRGDNLLEDSVLSVLSVTRSDLRKNWKIRFIGEEDVERGDFEAHREWFQLVTEEVFNPDNGLWKPSSESPLCMDINPVSHFFHPENDSRYYRFVGRIMAKAVFDQQLVLGHMARYLYKHLVGWPVTLEDLELMDRELYKFLNDVLQFDDDILQQMNLNFTTSQDYLGEMKTVELVEDGANINVTRYNRAEYVEFRVKYELLGKVQRQLTELLLGFFDLMEEPLLTVFDYQEIELLMCGLPQVNVDDWRENTEYSGEYESLGGDHQVCKWFWEIVENFDHEHRARLLQFTTGTSAVPSQGFVMLQAIDGSARKFTIHGVSTSGKNKYPSTHTYFNTIHLPMYSTKSKLRNALSEALESAATAFGTAGFDSKNTITIGIAIPVTDPREIHP